jgi:ribosomal protein S18 acetylase RimI-like enzyme
MNEFIFREATANDIPFLVETIIEAEKSGTDILSYSTIFGLSTEDARKYIEDMLLEEVDGCELSVSSFLVAEKKGHFAAAAAAWIEGNQGIPSTILKGNLLNFTLPKECIERSITLNHIIRDVHIEYRPETIQLGLVYVLSDFRGLDLVRLLIDEHILRFLKVKPDIAAMYVQVFANNFPAIRAYEKANFKVIHTKESSNEAIFHYLPSNKKVLMKKELGTK